jgi:hypothetical protein
MRSLLLVSSLVVLTMTAGSALAQTGSNTNAGGPTTYGGAAFAPVYNTNAMPITTQPGRNAPSYSFNSGSTNAGNVPYGFDPRSFPTGGNSLSPQEAARLSAQRDAQAQLYEQEYLARLQAASDLQRNNLMLGQMQNLQNGGFVNPFIGQAEEDEKPKKRRVVYGERNNPLQTPPRLFNPDQ